jgi:hypothetical protein
VEDNLQNMNQVVLEVDMHQNVLKVDNHQIEKVDIH